MLDALVQSVCNGLITEIPEEAAVYPAEDRTTTLLCPTHPLMSPPRFFRVHSASLNPPLLPRTRGGFLHVTALCVVAVPCLLQLHRPTASTLGSHANVLHPPSLSSFEPCDCDGKCSGCWICRHHLQSQGSVMHSGSCLSCDPSTPECHSTIQPRNPPRAERRKISVQHGRTELL